MNAANRKAEAILALEKAHEILDVTEAALREFEARLAPLGFTATVTVHVGENQEELVAAVASMTTENKVRTDEYDSKLLKRKLRLVVTEVGSYPFMATVQGSTDLGEIP